MTLFDKIRELLRVHSEDPKLMTAQLDALTRQIPLFYLIVSVNVTALCWSFYGTAPNLLTIWLPGIIVVGCVVRASTWYLRRKRLVLPTSQRELALRLKLLTVIASALAIVLITWCGFLADYGSDTQKTHIAFFVAVTMIAALLSTIQFPTAAVLAMVFSMVGLLLKFAVFGSRETLAISLNILPVMAVCVVLSWKYFNTLKNMLTSTDQLARANADLKEMTRDLEYHRDNLDMEVRKQTLELTDQKLKLEQALAKERELNQLQNEFVSMVSHEFRTPLTIIDGMARRVHSRMDRMSDEDVLERMEKIRSSVGRLSNLVERTLDASKIASGRIKCELEELDPLKTLSECIGRQKDISPDFVIDLHAEDLPSTMVADVRLLDHIFSNLLSNAVKYSGSSKHVDVTARANDGSIYISVRDYGVGIPAAELARLTERFFRASTSVGIQGTGIGLNLVKDLVGLHDGKLSFSSVVGEGTTVDVRLPIAGPSGQTTDVPEQPLLDQAG
ncbi:MAG: hypothetical protein CMK07_09500 [Ponticaulis sp.]|nr:hypothetical protein [Ponticaulis sp.]